MKIRFVSPNQVASDVSPPAGGKEVSAYAVNDFPTVLLAGAGLATLVGVIWYLLFGVRPSVWVSPSWKSIGLGIAFMVTHELFHVAALPRHARRVAIVGLLAQRAAAFVYFHGTLTKARSVVYLVVPFLALTVLPMLAAVTITGPQPEVSFVALWNAFASCSDLMLAIAVMREVPSGASVLWGGPQLHWVNRANPK